MAARRPVGRAHPTTVGSTHPSEAARTDGAGVADPGLLPPVVGLGSSAGGLEALTRFFRAMPADSGLAFVIVQHLDPTHGSQMAELLGRCTSMPVVQVEGDTALERDHVYCIPPGRYLGIVGRTLRLTGPLDTGSVRMPIDHFLRSLAEVPGRPIGILLSGTGSDGTLGLRAVKAAGGLAIVQDPDSAQHDGMPRSAIAAGAVDHVIAPEQMPAVLLGAAARGAGTGVEIGHDHLDGLLTLLQGRTRFDFRAYKRSTLARRIDRRMALHHVDDVEAYARLLTNDPAEAAALFDDLLISVSSFFRDPEAWKFLQERVLRPLVRADGHAALRVWVPGCATGEEPYSVAMLLAEELEAWGARRPVQIFASDVDLGALEFARAGLYPEGIAADVPRERLARFFHLENGAFRVTKALREMVLFARQNLVGDPPFSNVDLICCRNVLMYFEPGAQKKILSLLHFALVEDGHLFLGTAETTGQQEDLFAVVSKTWRTYRRVGPTRHDRVQFPVPAAHPSDRTAVASPRRPDRLGALAQQVVLERYVPACVLINRRDEILYFAGPTQDYLVQPTGVPTLDLISRTRDGLQSKLRAAIRKAVADGQRTVVTGARALRGDRWHRVRLTVEPLSGAREIDGLLLVTFADEPETPPPVPDDPDPSRQHAEPLVRELEDELRTTRADLQSSVEDLEVSNQELRVANEEVMSVNEELRSSNEELETSKEELQSLNEELTTVNAELEQNVAALQGANNDLDNLLTSSNVATVFLDTKFHVRRFTPAATRLFDLSAADVGRPIGDVASRCTDPDLVRDAAAVLATLGSISKEIQDRHGRWFVRQVLPYRTHDDRIEGVVITFSDVAAEALQEARLYAEAVVDTVREPLVVLDADLAVQSANRAFYQTFELSPESTVGRPIHEIGAGQLNVPTLRRLLGDVLPERGMVTDFEVEHEIASLGPRTLLLNARTLARGGGRPNLILLALEDVTDRKGAERAMRESAAMTRAGVQTAIDGVITIDERATILSFNPAAERMFGFTADEVVGKSFGMLEAPPDPHETRGALERHLHIGAREGRGRRKDGTTFACELHGSEFDDGSGRRLVVTVRDVTERKRTEEQVRRQQGEMAHVLRVATIERFAAGLAHELNQPLTAIANDVEASASYVRSGKGGSRRLLRLLDRAGAEALRAGEIVHHLREFVQRTEPRLEWADLCEVARNATRWLAREMEQEHITLRLAFAAPTLPVRVDRIQIEQVFVNLMQNAIDSIRDARRQRRWIRVRTSRTADGMAEVAFDDTGGGVSPLASERLYEPFFTTKPQGMGMGLAICLTIAEAHRGRLSVEPRKSGAGTTVRLLLPLEGPS
jgi:two-component system CheB/CheR fusion protein